MSNEPQPPEAELARLADGTLDPSREEELRARVKDSPALAHALAEQERAVSMLRSTSSVNAPDALRARLDAMLAEPAEANRTTRQRERKRPRFRLRLALPAVAAAVAVAAVAVVLVIGSGSSGPTLPQTARAALSASTLPPPAESPTNPGHLDARVGGIAFPYWSRDIGWRTVGQRHDTLGGRRVETVFYAGHGGTRVGYAIVSGAPIEVTGDRTVHENGTTYTLFDEGTARGVTWRRDGHTCVIAGHGVSDATLLTLASAERGGTTASYLPSRGASGSSTV